MDAQTRAELEAKAAEYRKTHQGPVTVKLSDPVEWGKERDGTPKLITELTLKPVAAAFRDFKMTMCGDGGFVYEPYRFAVVGLAMAGQPPGLADRLSIEDMNEIAAEVQGFFLPSLLGGRGPSQS